MPKILWAVTLSAFLASCVSTESILASRGKDGHSFVCTASYDRTYAAALASLHEQQLKIIRKDSEQGYLVASDTIGFSNGGGRVAIFLYNLGPSKTQVELHSKPFIRLPLPTSYWAARQRRVEIEGAIRSALA